MRNGGCRGVNLRQIAARARCAHTNAYNYFDSLEDLFWEALRQALESHTTDVEQQLGAAGGRAKPLQTLLSVSLEFAQRNPGLYRLCWIEPLTGEPPPVLLQRLDHLRQLWVRCIVARLTELRSATDPRWAGQIIHGYFHGEVCKLIGRHAFLPAAKDDCARIFANTLALVDLVAAKGGAPR